MPFGLKLKRSKNYSVISKSLCVIVVKLLENGTVECILSSRTSGQDCLENVCQRLQIAQTQYFGLRYATKDAVQRWVDLDRPLKKQLDKYAQEFSLTLDIMFYVFNVDNLTDELTRYYYFSHLKSDILEGRLRCSRDEAIQLASYSLQAEFGDHRPEHHTPEYLKNFVLIPKYLTGVAGGNQDVLLEEIIGAHQNLHGMLHADAEIHYLIAVQRLDGYGEEVFYVKDHHGQDVTLGVSALGVRVRYPARINEHSVAYQWSEIVDLIHHKKFFKIEGRHSNSCAQFQLDDVITAKYIWKQCVQQHKFYMQIKQIESARRSRDNTLNRSAGHAKMEPSTPSKRLSLMELPLNNNEYSISTQDLYGEQEALSAAPMHLKNSINRDHTRIMNGSATSSSMGSLDELDSGVYHTETQIASLGNPMTQPKEEPDYENVSMLLATSDEVRRTLLPEYRKAPDYEQAVRMKYPISASLNDLSHAAHRHHVNRLCGNYASSIPSSNIDISPTSKSYNPIIPLNASSQYGQYTDLQRIGNSSQELIYSRQMSKTTPNLAYQAMHTYSTPELNITIDRSKAPLDRVRSIQATVTVTSPSTSVPDLTDRLRPEEERGAPSQSKADSPARARGPDPPSNVVQGPMLLAAMNGLAGSIKPHTSDVNDQSSAKDIVKAVVEISRETPKDSRIVELESKLAGGHVFQEFEQIVKKKPMANFATAMLAENMPRNRFKDVLPYDENRVRLGPSKDNRTGYINASHVSVSIGEMHRFYIAAQGPMNNTSFHFWQMIWENNVAIIVMLTDVVENGKEKCHPYWPQADDSRVTFKDFVITRKTTFESTTFTTCALQVQYLPTRVTKTVYHLQYTDWPDHGCPMDIHGFLSFMEEIESVRRLVLSEQSVSLNRAVRNAPVVMHCTAGVGRSGVVILCDLLLFCLDHNHPTDVPQALTHIRYQRMLSVQTLAQYKFVYQVLIQYLKNSRLI